ncbi:MAG TPA: hypothetical protein VHY56_01610 [Candidatus Binataceae bacterium]|nr:hypothetical protein [Candidatus Binataceae bacterium]
MASGVCRRATLYSAARTLLICLIAAGGCAYTIVHDGAVNQTRAEQVEQGIARFRQLSFVSPVPLVVKSRDQVQQMLLTELKRNHTDEELNLGGETGAMTGVYPPAMNLKSSTLSLMHSQIAAFYNPHDKQMVLVEGAINLSLWNSAANLITRRDPTGEMILAHELTHALQDQHFHLERMMNAVKDNDDRDLALKALAEGDATLSGFGYVNGNLDNAALNTILLRLADLPKTLAAQSGNLPLGLSAPMVFQYYDGARFVADGYRRGGWSAVDAIYRDPPQATLQIMRPDLYFNHTFRPANVTLDGYQPFLKDWQKADDDTYGAFLLQVILRRNLGDNSPEVALADQWTADRLIVLRKGSALTILWLVRFSGDGGAAKFAADYTRILNGIQVSHPFRIATKSNEVFIAIGGGSRAFNQFAPAVWNSSNVTPAPRATHILMAPSAAITAASP